MSLGLAGAVTIALVVVLGIFVYPALLGRRGGPVLVALLTVALAALFTWFDQAVRSADSLLLSAVFGVAWALGPVLAGTIVFRLQRRG